MPSVKIEKLVFGGQGMGYWDNKAAFVWNALPGEEVEVDMTYNKKTHSEGTAIKINNPSPDRIEPLEDHASICSAWSVMTLEAEQKWKEETAREVYDRMGGIKLPSYDMIWETGLSGEKITHGYRNKIEYSFGQHPDGRVSFAFFERGKRNRRPIDCCLLASKEINETAQTIFDWVIKKDISLRSLKALIVRSNKAGETIAALFIKDEMKFREKEIQDLLSKSFIGFQIYYSTHKSPASVPTKLLYSVGTDAITENLAGVTFSYGALSFFQICPPIFERALEDIRAHIDPSLPLVDFYAGVGSIGLTLASSVPSVQLVESNPEAVENAEKNIRLNDLSDKVTAILSPAEKVTEYITGECQVIVDPPRAGLHPDVVKRLLEAKPKRIIYLSCDLSTQARDIKMLSEAYTISFSRLYNFFPRTPHIEGLVVLELQ